VGVVIDRYGPKVIRVTICSFIEIRSSNFAVQICGQTTNGPIKRSSLNFVQRRMKVCITQEQCLERCIKEDGQMHRVVRNWPRSFHK